ncbi:MAG: hypothetical protein EPGJADBJ_00250 [Saprospiraceae bacterium]|nr:hypothetical protein [Saprospiraceae bacterium]
MGRMSIQGIQPKLSAVLNTRKQSFEIVDIYGRFIIKPQHEIHSQLPENEDLTMRMATQVGIETPLHGMIWCKDGSLSYFIRRFDRVGRNGKLAVEDFAQLAGLSRETKYDFTVEKMIRIIEEHCTFPVPEKYKFFRLLLFCFLTGNEDMHLKNFSLITRDNRVEFSPAYDLLNSTLALGGAEDEMALMLAGKRKGFRRRDLVDYLGRERLGLTDVAIENVLTTFRQAQSKWEHLIGISFLSSAAQQTYRKILKERFERFYQ